MRSSSAITIYDTTLRDGAQGTGISFSVTDKIRIAAFGSTRRANLPVDQDPQVKLLLDAATPTVTIFGKSWLLQVTEVLGVSPQENTAMIAETVRFLKANHREVIYDAEHFFDGAKDDWKYAMETLTAARDAGADLIVLCDTNGGSMPDDIGYLTR